MKKRYIKIQKKEICNKCGKENTLQQWVTSNRYVGWTSLGYCESERSLIEMNQLLDRGKCSCKRR